MRNGTSVTSELVSALNPATAAGAQSTASFRVSERAVRTRLCDLEHVLQRDGPAHLVPGLVAAHVDARRLLQEVGRRRGLDHLCKGVSRAAARSEGEPERGREGERIHPRRQIMGGIEGGRRTKSNDLSL